MIIADSDPEKAKKMVAEAAPKVFTSNADKAAFPYISTPPNYNPIAQNMNSLYTSRQDFIPSATIVTPMNELNDPRRPFFFSTINDKYVGGQYGFLNTYSAFSHVSDKIIDPAFEGLLLDYSEVEFLLAEAAVVVLVKGRLGGDLAAPQPTSHRHRTRQSHRAAHRTGMYLSLPIVSYISRTRSLEISHSPGET